jgi:hypothetical protein
VLALERFKPIIGAVNGWCLGQGMIYLLSLTDIRIASTNAKFGFPEVAYGMGGAGGTSRLGLQLPHTVAMWMLLTGEAMEAEEALSHRLVNKVVAPDALMATAREGRRQDRAPSAGSGARRDGGLLPGPRAVAGRRPWPSPSISTGCSAWACARSRCSRRASCTGRAEAGAR